MAEKVVLGLSGGVDSAVAAARLREQGFEVHGLFLEVGLGGELRSVSHAESRIKEAEKLGFSEIILPKQCIDKLSKNDYSIKLSGVSNVSEAFSVIRRKEGRPE